jgi:hypothetical protein
MQIDDFSFQPLVFDIEQSLHGCFAASSVLLLVG